MTISYTAKPVDDRCKWWSVRIPAGYTTRNTFALDDETSMRPLGFLRKGADLELEIGEAVIDSEAMHHRKHRGFTVSMALATKRGTRWVNPSAAIKAAIKSAATPEQWERLKRGSSDVAACLRVLMAIELFTAEQLRQVDTELADAIHGVAVAS